MLSVVILARNEAENLKQLLPTLAFADRVLVVDDYSTDETAKLCQRYKAERFLHRLNNDYALARNTALEVIKRGWVLFLDADERLPPATVDEIKQVTLSPKGPGYVFRRKDVFYGKQLNWGETGAVRLLRLGLVGEGKWRGKVHEVWSMSQTKEMQHEILHYSHGSISQLFEAVTRYARIRAEELWEQQNYWNLFEQLIYPLAKFGYLFFIRLGFLDGWRGLIMSAAMAYHSFLVRWNLWDLPWIKEKRTTTYIWRLLMVTPILLLPFGQLGRGSVLPVYAHEIFMMLAVGITGLVYLKKKVKTQLKISKPLVGLSLVFGLSYVISLGHTMPVSGGLQLLRWYLYVTYLICWLWGIKNGLMVSVAGLISYYAVGLLGLGWLQYVIRPDVRFLALLGWDDHYYRMVGTLFDPNFLGLMLVLIFVWGLGQLKGIGGYVMALLAAIGLMATFSRASWLAFGVVLAGGRFGRLGRFGRVGLGVVGLLAVAFLLLPKPGGEGVNIWRQYSVATRIESWTGAVKMAKENFWLGIGYNQYGNVVAREGKFGVPYHPQSPDNSFLFVWVTSGVVGLGVFIWLLLDWWKAYPNLVIRLSLLAIIVHSLANNSFFYSFVLLWWWLLLVQGQVSKTSEKS